VKKLNFWAINYRKTKAQRDNAWKELKKIRECIKADKNESTYDEVVSLKATLENALVALADSHEYIMSIDHSSCKAMTILANTQEFILKVVKKYEIRDWR